MALAGLEEPLFADDAVAGCTASPPACPAP